MVESIGDLHKYFKAPFKKIIISKPRGYKMPMTQQVSPVSTGISIRNDLDRKLYEYTPVNNLLTEESDLMRTKK